MFRNKKIEEYKRISNNVKLPKLREGIEGEESKIIKLNGKDNRNERGNRKMKKLIASGLIAAALGGIVIFNNVGGGVTGVEKVNNDIIVYASENDGQKVKLEKGKELIIDTDVVKISGEGKERFKKRGIVLNIISEDMRTLKLKTDKGELDNGQVEITEDKDEKVVLQKENTKEIEIEFKKEDKEIKNFIDWYYDKEMAELRKEGKLNKETFGTVNIQMEATYEDGRVQTGQIQLTMNEDGQLVGKIN